MTLSPDTVHLWYKEYPMFWQWAQDKDILFLQKLSPNDETYDLASQIYVLMKRLRQSYESILMMPDEDRENLFKMEMELMKQEAKNQENNT